MTPEELANVTIIGRSLLANVVSVIPATLLYGMFIYLFGHSTAITIHRGLRSWPARVMFITSLTTFILTSLLWGAFIAALLIQLKAGLVDDLAEFAQKRKLAAINAQIFPCMVIENWVDQLVIYISDGIVVWRAWVLFSEERWMMMLPAMLLLASIATGLAYLALMSSLSAFIAVQLRQATITLNLVTANLALSFATNVVATLMILYRLWRHRRIVGVKALGAPSAVQKVLVTLVESGAFYCAVQLPRVILYASPVKPYTPRYYVTQVILTIASMLTSMYPTMVIVLVNQHRTMVEFFGFDTGLGRTRRPIDEEHHPVTLGHLSFARPPTSHTTTHLADMSSTRPEYSDSSIEKRPVSGNNDKEMAPF
ncbi:hypothetical protein LshimejAT787_1700430 [Lyophyllum shimeji]|uniref:Uncharacterized protein n=1 Tax=Lyophyllum shimeji TaxID=47721 RepID=A0A9P3Q0C2_LYOSH|nr:hypothetical protein LshimejAT787_1700430 [Lyophyllum shimeji]